MKRGVIVVIAIAVIIIFLLLISQFDLTGKAVTSSKRKVNTQPSEISTDKLDKKESVAAYGYIIKLKGGPLSKLGNSKDNLRKIENEQTNVKIKIKDKIAKGQSEKEFEKKIKNTYQKVFNGFAMDITEEEAGKLKELDEISEVYQDLIVNTTLMDSVPLINADDVWQLNSRGESCVTSSDSNTIEWEKTFDKGKIDIARGISVKNDITVVGESQSTNYDGMLLKYTNTGSLTLDKVYGTTGNEFFYDVTTDSIGDSYSVGRKTSSTYSNPQRYIVKTDTTGTVKWSISIGNGIAYGVTLDSNENPIVVGYDDTATLLWIVKYSKTDGTEIWKKTHDTQGYQRGRKIKTDSSDNIYVVGETSYPNLDAIVLKFDSNGNLLWNKVYGGAKEDFAFDIDINNDIIAITGFTRSYGESNNAGAYNLWTYRIDSSGNIIWSNAIGSAKDDRGQGIVIGNDGIYVAGYTYSFSPDGSQDGWIIKYDYNGNMLYDKTIGNNNYDTFEDIGIDINGDIYLVGQKYGLTRDVWIVKIKESNSDNNCLTGTGIKIAILDTGVDYIHEDLGGCNKLDSSSQCFAESKITHSSCTDSDGGENICVNSLVTKTGSLTTFSYDSCKDDFTVKEKTCTSSGQIAEVIISCPGGSVCQGGRCIKSDPLKTACSKVVDGWDFVTCDSFGFGGASCLLPKSEDPYPMDQHRHGTHVAAIAAGNGILKGVAPDAQIYSYRVLNNLGQGLTSWVIAGIERAVDPNNDGDFSDHVDVISMSLGANCFGYSIDCGPDDPQSQAVDNAVDAGVVVVVAAGNSGPSSSTITSPGTARKAITVGATYKKDYTGTYWKDTDPKVEQITSFSSRGPVLEEIKPDIVAPGAIICAAEWGAYASNSRCLDDKHIQLSGTSMAAPHVAGAIALIKQKYPNLSPPEIKSLLIQTSKSHGVDLFTEGTGIIDVLKAISANLFVNPSSYHYDINQRSSEKTFSSNFNIIQFNNEKKIIKISTSINTPEILINTNPSEIDTSKNEQISITFSALGQEFKEGLYSGTITLTDGLKQSNIPFTLKIDYSPPIISDPRLASIYKAKMSERKIVWNTDDITSSQIFYKNKVEDSFRNSGVIHGTVYRFDVSEFEPGSYEYYITATNKGGGFSIDNNNGEFYKFGIAEPDINENRLTQVGSLPLSRISFTNEGEMDINSDGKKDIILITQNEPEDLTIYSAEGDNNYRKSYQMRITSSGTSHSYIPLDIDDSDNDGLKEILIIDTRSDKIIIYEQSSPYSYFDVRTWEISTGTNLLTAEFADLDGDGKKEIIFTDLNMNIYENTGDNTYQLVYQINNPSISQIKICNDFNNNGKNEIIGKTGSKTLIIFESTGDNSYSQLFSKEMTAYDGNDLNIPILRCLDDLNKNGKKEIVLGGFIVNSGNRNEFIQLESDDYKKINSIVVETSLYYSVNVYINIADVNLDGLEDIILISKNDYMLILENMADDVYKTIYYEDISSPISSSSIKLESEIGDFDQDGKVEIIFNKYDNTVIYEFDSINM